jgi:hypothetical protein
MRSCDSHHSKRAAIPRRAHVIGRKRIFGFVWLNLGIIMQLAVVFDTRLYIVRALPLQVSLRSPSLAKRARYFPSTLEGSADLAVCESPHVALLAAFKTPLIATG